MKLFELSGRVAVVTGGTAGIAQGLAAAGAAIVVAGRRSEKNLAAARALEQLEVKTAAVELDVRSEASCRAMVETAVQRFGRLDILVNNAGTTIRKQPQALTLAE